jgi:hypothetical protein
LREPASSYTYPYQEEFLRDPFPLTAACCGRQVGKTTLAAIKALQYALAKKSVRILTVSAELRQSMILFDRILTFIDEAIPATALPVYKTRIKGKFATSIRP